MTRKYIWAAILTIFLVGCGREDKTLQGYLEADMVYASPISAGRIDKINVARGDKVKKGDLLFTQENTEYVATVAAAEALLQKSRADLQNLLKGARPEEIDALKAKIARIEAVCKLSQLENQRAKRLYEREAVPAKDYDTTRLILERNEQDLAEARYNLSVARLPARADQIRMAQEAVKAAENELAAAQWRLEQRQTYAPADAVVFDVLLRKGEVATAGMSVAALIPFDNFKVRFFVSGNRLAQIETGDRITVLLDSHGRACPATINYVSPRPEYTPPIIYSRENTAKLVFMVEAVIDKDKTGNLHPGMPVRVMLSGDARP